MMPTRAPLDLSEPYYVLETTKAPVIQVPHGNAPWDWLWLPTTLVGILALAFAIHCCARGKTAMILETLDLPHTFWLIWELLLVVDITLGVAFLFDLLHERFLREAPYWDVLSVVQASVLLFEAAIHGAAFLGFGVLPTLARILATGVLQRRNGHSWTLLRYKNVQHRMGARKPDPEVPPELDTEQNPSPLHYLVGASLWAVCRASEQDLEIVIPYKVGINAFHFSGSVIQFFLAAFFVSHPWPRAVSVGVSIASMCITLLIGIVLGLVVLRAHHVGSSGLIRLDVPNRGINPLGIADEAPKAPMTAPRVGLKGAPNVKAPRSLGKAQVPSGRTWGKKECLSKKRRCVDDWIFASCLLSLSDVSYLHDVIYIVYVHMLNYMYILFFTYCNYRYICILYTIYMYKLYIYICQEKLHAGLQHLTHQRVWSIQLGENRGRWVVCFFHEWTSWLNFHAMQWKWTCMDSHSLHPL